jgi:hypothetical protein
MDEYFDEQNSKHDQANARERVGKILTQLKTELEHLANTQHGKNMKSFATFSSDRKFVNGYSGSHENSPKPNKTQIAKNRISEDLKKSKKLRQKFLHAKKRDIPVHEFALTESEN